MLRNVLEARPSFAYVGVCEQAARPMALAARNVRRDNRAARIASNAGRSFMDAHANVATLRRLARRSLRMRYPRAALRPVVLASIALACGFIAACGPDDAATAPAKPATRSA